MGWQRKEREILYCPKLGHCVASRSVCERRSLEVMQPAWPECAGCDHEAVLTDEFDKANMTTYSDPPPRWYNMERYREVLGVDACTKARKGMI